MALILFVLVMGLASGWMLAHSTVRRIAALAQAEELETALGVALGEGEGSGVGVGLRRRFRKKESAWATEMVQAVRDKGSGVGEGEGVGCWRRGWGCGSRGRSRRTQRSSERIGACHPAQNPIIDSRYGTADLTRARSCFRSVRSIVPARNFDH
jgi:hypothetical protein